MRNVDIRPVAIIEARLSGFAAALNLDRQGVDWAGFEIVGDVGGLCNISAPRSTKPRALEPMIIAQRAILPAQTFCPR